MSESKKYEPQYDLSHDADVLCLIREHVGNASVYLQADILKLIRAILARAALSAGEAQQGEREAFEQRCYYAKGAIDGCIALERDDDGDYTDLDTDDAWEVWQWACKWQREQATLSQPRQMVADSAGGAEKIRRLYLYVDGTSGDASMLESPVGAYVEYRDITHLLADQPPAAAEAERDAARLDWLLHKLSGKEMRRIGIQTLSGGPIWGRVAIDAAIAAQQESGE